jgi:hypothetical protein
MGANVPSSDNIRHAGINIVKIAFVKRATHNEYPEVDNRFAFETGQTAF